jgi:hypothetical protein
MAVTVSVYNHTRKLFANGEVDLADVKVMLRNDTTVFNAAHTVIGDLAGAEVHGGGWTEGGEPIDSLAVTVVATNGAMLDGTDVSVTATGSAIGPAYKAVIYDDDTTTKNLLFFIDFGAAEEAGVGTDFKIVWNADGIHRWLEPAV